MTRTFSASMEHKKIVKHSSGTKKKQNVANEIEICLMTVFFGSPRCRYIGSSNWHNLLSVTIEILPKLIPKTNGYICICSKMAIYYICVYGKQSNNITKKTW